MQRVSTVRTAAGQRSEVLSGRWAEASHLFRPSLAPNWKMLPSARHRASRFDVGAPSSPQVERLLRSPR
eukprot:2462566-Prymnesium_polylepis.1